MGRDPKAGVGRRTFLKTTALSAASVGLGCASPPGPSPSGAPPRRETGPGPHPELAVATVGELAAGLERGDWTVASLARATLARLEALDREGPMLRSVLETNPDLEALAGALDRERRGGRVRGPLHGLPVLLKDNIDTGDRMATTAGSVALAAAPAPEDAPLVRRLRAAGALVLGKTNLSEWANFRSTNSSSGWSARGGQTRNPYVLDRNPCGSSSGSGVAVSAGLAVVAVGTETDGSIVCPSHQSGVVGIKPTLGRVSRTGIVPIAHSQDTAGPMARTVTDALILLRVLAGPDPADPITRQGGRPLPDPSALRPGALRGARLGLLGPPFVGYSRAADRVLAEAVAALRDAGATVLEDLALPHAGAYDDDELTVLLVEFKHDLARYLARRPGLPVKTLADVIAFNRDHAEVEMPWFGQELFLMAEAKGGLDDAAYLEARERARRLAGPEGIDALMDAHRLDALVAPTGGPAWTTDPINGDRYLGSCSTPAAVAGYPHVTVPMGSAHGLPVGLSFFGRAFSEDVLIPLAYAFEQATLARRVPRFLPGLPQGPAGAPIGDA